MSATQKPAEPHAKVHAQAPTEVEAEHPVDGVEAIVPMIPFVLPIAGGILMFLLAFIAVSMA